MLTEHEPVPEQAPDQPEKIEVELGVALRVTVVSTPKLALHVEPQLMPAGELVTVPPPSPAFVTKSEKPGGFAVKVAVTERAWVMLTEHDPVPEQAPDQPEKIELESGAALRVTAVPESKAALHVEPQVMPAGELVTVPPPSPAFVTESE